MDVHTQPAAPPRPLARHRWRHLPTDEQAERWLDAAEEGLRRMRRHLGSVLALGRLAGKDFGTSVRRDGGGGEGAASPTERLAMAMTPDELEADRALAQDAMAALGVVVALAERMTNLRAAPLEVPRLMPAGAGDCAACGRWCTGQPRYAGGEADRLRSGFCDTDYRAWIRAGRPDRAAFIASRRAGAGVEGQAA